MTRTADDTSAAPDLQRQAVPAEPDQLNPLRDQLAAWAREACLTAERVGDVLLAVYEAMANVVVHAYPGRLGTFDLYARHAGSTVTVTIRDYGQWRPVPRPTVLGGRGLPMIRTLADRALIETGSAGTTVTMTWECDCPRSP